MVDFTFNSVSSATKNITVMDIQKPLMPIQKVSYLDIPKYPGIVLSTRKFGSNEIKVRIKVPGTTYENLLANIVTVAAYLYTDTPKTLIFSDQPSQYYTAQHTETVEVKRTYLFSIMDLVFTCTDPFAYATTATSDFQRITSSGTTYALTNSGHVEAYPTISLFFYQAQNHIYIENTSIEGNRMDIVKAFGVSSELVIDCKNMTMKLNGASSMSGLGDGGEGLAEFIMLSSGSNTIEVGTEDSTLDVGVTISFNKPYLY